MFESTSALFTSQLPKEGQLPDTQIYCPTVVSASTVNVLIIDILMASTGFQLNYEYDFCFLFKLMLHFFTISYKTKKIF